MKKIIAAMVAAGLAISAIPTTANAAGCLAWKRSPRGMICVIPLRPLGS